MGSKSSSSQKTTTNYNTDTRNASISDNQGLALANVSGDVSVLDGGAIEESFNFASLVGEQYTENVNDVFDFSRSIIAESVEGATKAVDVVGGAFDRSLGAVSSAYESARSDDKEDLVKMGLVITAGVVAAGMVGKK